MDFTELPKLIELVSQLEINIENSNNYKKKTQIIKK